MTPALGTDPPQVMGWKRFTDNHLGLFGSFMAAFFPPGLVFSTLRPFTMGTRGFSPDVTEFLKIYFGAYAESEVGRLARRADTLRPFTSLLTKKRRRCYRISSETSGRISDGVSALLPLLN